MTILSNSVQLALDITGKLNPYGWLNAFVNGDRVLLIDEPNMYIRCGYTYYAQFLFNDSEMPKGSSWMYRRDFYSPGKLPKFYKDKPSITAKDFGVIGIDGCETFEDYLARLKRTNRRKVKSLPLYDVRHIPFGEKFLDLVEKSIKQLERQVKGLDEEELVATFNNLKAHVRYVETKYELESHLKPYLLEFIKDGKTVGYSISYDLYTDSGVVCVNATDILKSKDYNVKSATASSIDWAIAQDNYSFLDMNNALGMDDPSMYYKHQFYTDIGGGQLYFDSQETLDAYLKVNWKAYGVPFEIETQKGLEPLSFIGVDVPVVKTTDSYCILSTKLADLKGSTVVELINYLRTLEDPDAPELDNRIVPLMMNPNSVMDFLCTLDGHLLSMTICYPVHVHKDSFLDKFVDPDIFKDAWYLDEMYTPILERKKGYAKLLLSHTLKDKPNISLTVAENNPAILLYQGLGFKLLDRVPNYYPNLTATDPYSLTGLTLYRNVNT